MVRRNTVERLHKNHDAYFVPGLHRGLMVLEALSREGRPLKVVELAKVLSLTRSAIFRLIYTLRLMGFVEPEGGGFTLGPRVLNIGFSYLASKSIVDTARPELETLRDRTNVSTHLAIRDGRDVLYLSCVQTKSGFLSNMNVGSRVPAHASPMGWLLLGDLSDERLAELYARRRFERLTAATPRNLASLGRRIREAMRKSCVISRGTMEAGGSSIAAPVFDRTGKIVAAIDISGPDSAFDLAQIEKRYVDDVVNAALRISERLGYSSRRRPAR